LIRSAQWEARLVDGTTVKASFFATGKADTFADGHCTSADLAGAVKFCFCGQLAAAFTASPPRLWEVDATVHPPRSIEKAGNSRSHARTWLVRRVARQPAAIATNADEHLPRGAVFL
jgi:hypothetical protein